jgi:predicted acylesterase/phospholipase RssA
LQGISVLRGGKPVSECFDLIAGTSTGAIIALSLALNKDLEQVVDFFRRDAGRIFDPRTFAGFRKGPRYDPEPLRSALTRVFGEEKLRECGKPVVIAATTLNRFSIRTFTTLNRKREDPDQELSVVDVIMASCAAPTFFPPVRPSGERRDYVDGGLWANTPSLLAVMEAHAYAGVEFSDIRLVRIGNGKFPEGTIGDEFKTVRPYSPSTILALFDMMFATQDSAADDFLRKLIGEHNSFELDVQLPTTIKLDDAQSAIKILPGLAQDVARNNFNSFQTFLGLVSGFSVATKYFDGTNRDILGELSFFPGKSLTRNPDELAKIVNEGTTLRIERLDLKSAWIISVSKYQNTESASTNAMIPADPSPTLQGEYIRYIRVRFNVRVQSPPQMLVVRLLNPDGHLLKSGISGNADAEREVRITNSNWTREECQLGPIRAGQPCYVSLEDRFGPVGEENSIFMKDLEIDELRPKHWPEQVY